MPFTIEEGLIDLPEVEALVAAVVAAIKAIKPAGPGDKPSFEADGKVIAAILPQLGKLVDTVKAQIAS